MIGFNPYDDLLAWRQQTRVMLSGTSEEKALLVGRRVRFTLDHVFVVHLGDRTAIANRWTV